jgi:hypothetical protein
LLGGNYVVRPFNRKKVGGAKAMLSAAYPQSHGGPAPALPTPENEKGPRLSGASLS